MSSMTRLGVRFGRHTATYASGSVVSLVLGFATFAILTRFLSPDEFGVLAVLMLFASLLGVLYTLGLLQGAFAWVFGSAGEEEADDSEGAGVGVGGQRPALTTALLLIALVGAVGTLVIAAFLPFFSHIVTGDRDDEELVLIAACSGALGAVWRFIHNVPRLERRPGLFVGLTAVRPLFVLAVGIPLVATGHGVRGAVSGVAIGTALAVVAGLVVTRRSYRLAFNLADVKGIARAGRPFIVVIAALWILHNSDVYLLSRTVSNDDVGIYRVASRVASLMSYFVSAFLMAWGPLSHTSTFKAIRDEHGHGDVSSTVTTYFVISALAVFLFLAAAADVLVRVAAPSYADAAGLMPVIALGFMAYGSFVLVYRISRFRLRRTAYVGLSLTAAVVLNVSALLLIPHIDAYGAAVATILGPAVATVGMLALSQRGANPIPFDWRRIVAAFAIGGLCISLVVLASTLDTGARLLIELGALALFPVLLYVTGTLPREHLGAIRAVSAGLIPRRRGPEYIGERVAELPPEERASLETMVRRGTPPAAAAGRGGRSADEVRGEAVDALRRLSGLEEEERRPADATLAAYLLEPAAVAEHDAQARWLWSNGVSPGEIDLLEATLEDVRAAGHAVWGEPPDPPDRSQPAPLPAQDTL
jgi:O-antigen/teichoic acid export membrane protein